MRGAGIDHGFVHWLWSMGHMQAQTESHIIRLMARGIIFDRKAAATYMANNWKMSNLLIIFHMVESVKPPSCHVPSFYLVFLARLSHHFPFGSYHPILLSFKVVPWKEMGNFSISIEILREPLSIGTSTLYKRGPCPRSVHGRWAPPFCLKLVQAQPSPFEIMVSSLRLSFVGPRWAYHGHLAFVILFFSV